MPHLAVKMKAGRTQQQKEALTQALVEAVEKTLGCSEAVITVSIEDYEPSTWVEAVYQPEIVGKPEILFKKPGY